MAKNYWFIFALACVVCYARSANILGVFPLTIYSHHVLGRQLMLELAQRGHNVTVIDVYSETNVPENYKQIILEGLEEANREWKEHLIHLPEKNLLSETFFIGRFSIDVIHQIFGHPVFQKFVQNSDNNFDLVIVEQFIIDAIKVLGYKFKAPMLALSTMGTNNMVNSLMGNPTIPSYMPHFSSEYGATMNFWQRLHNLFIHVWFSCWTQIWIRPKSNRLVQEYFPGAPSIEELNNNISLVLLNSHVSTNQPLPLTPNMIEIGGYHVTAPKKLPKDLQEFLDNAVQGVLYFSMGSNMKAKGLPEIKRNAIVKAFAKVKENVLVKWEDDVLPGMSSNIKIVKWLPQQDVLAHPNVKLFITHGGLLSTIEAVYHGVPLLGIPVFGDQVMNMLNAVSQGYAVMLPLQELAEKSFAVALNKVLSNSSYAQNAKRRSQIMHDQPIKPLDKAIYWVEYVMRHRGAVHFRSAALDITWYQLYMIDILCFVVICIILIIYVLHVFIKSTYFRNCSNKLETLKKKN